MLTEELPTVRPPSAAVDETECDREPIHVPGSIQPHGMLFVLEEPSLTVTQVSETVSDYLGMQAGDILHQSLEQVFDRELSELLAADLERLPPQGRPILLRTVSLTTPGGEQRFHAIAHRSEAGVLLEFERAGDQNILTDLHAHVDEFSLNVESKDSIAEMSRLACEEVQKLTGFDRVLIYQFDDDWNGVVVGEAVNDQFPSLLDHRFPASDIPAQARELYRINRIRIIPDVDYRSSAIVPLIKSGSARPLDLTFSVLRSVSPVHVEYMRNMKTASSMSVSILRDGRLWGLISCHHRTPRYVPFPTRVTCDLFARAFSLRLSAIEHSSTYQRRLEVQGAFSRLLAQMADRGEFATALTERDADLLTLTGAGGAALITGDQCVVIGETPTEEECRKLADWLMTHPNRDLYATDSLAAEFPEAEQFSSRTMGLIAIATSRIHASFVMWFRPELLRTIRWGGDPRKRVDVVGSQTRLHPRRSFETWAETVRGRSRPWLPLEIDAVRDLRNAIVDVVLRKAEELAELTSELKRSNQELESFSYSVSHDLRAPLRHIVGYAEMLRDAQKGQLGATEERCIANIIDSSEYAGKLVDKLLSYSRLGRAELQWTEIDLNLLMREIRDDVMRDAEGRSITWIIDPLPTIRGDLMMLRMAFRDLASNAVKYTRHRPEAVIQIAAASEAQADVVWIADNGVGFDMKYADKLFGVFQRLHRWEDFEGTGIGLANVRRVIERHGGETWAEAAVDQGAKFFLRLPKHA